MTSFLIPFLKMYFFFTELVKEAMDTNEELASIFLPSCDASADKPENVYKFDDRILLLYGMKSFCSDISDTENALADAFSSACTCQNLEACCFM